MKAAFLIAAMALVGAVSAHGQAVTVVKFARGTTGATYNGRITGYKYHDYSLVARAGQTMEVKAESSNGGLEAVLFNSRKENVEGVIGAPEFTVTLPEDGKYMIRVLLVRSAARKTGAHADYSLNISVN